MISFVFDALRIRKLSQRQLSSFSTSTVKAVLLLDTAVFSIMVQGTCLPIQTAWGLPIRKFQTHLPTSSIVFWGSSGNWGSMSTDISVQVVFQDHYCYSIWSIGIVCSWCCVAGFISTCRGSAPAFCLCLPTSVLTVLVATGCHIDALPHGLGITVF